jgi:hypothetical protein
MHLSEAGLLLLSALLSPENPYNVVVSESCNDDRNDTQTSIKRVSTRTQKDPITLSLWYTDDEPVYSVILPRDIGDPANNPHIARMYRLLCMSSLPALQKSKNVK